MMELDVTISCDKGAVLVITESRLMALLESYLIGAEPFLSGGCPAAVSGKILIKSGVVSGNDLLELSEHCGQRLTITRGSFEEQIETYLLMCKVRNG